MPNSPHSARAKFARSRKHVWPDALDFYAKAGRLGCLLACMRSLLLCGTVCMLARKSKERCLLQCCVDQEVSAPITSDRSAQRGPSQIDASCKSLRHGVCGAGSFSRERPSFPSEQTSGPQFHSPIPLPNPYSICSLNSEGNQQPTGAPLR